MIAWRQIAGGSNMLAVPNLSCNAKRLYLLPLPKRHSTGAFRVSEALLEIRSRKAHDLLPLFPMAQKDPAKHDGQAGSKRYK